MTEDSALCLDKTLPQIKEKTKDLDRLFQRIDNLEAFVGVMKKQVDVVELRVDQAEKDLDMGIGSSFKKVFTSFFPKRQSQAPAEPPAFSPLTIIDTSAYFINPNQ